MKEMESTSTCINQSSRSSKSLVGAQQSSCWCIKSEVESREKMKETRLATLAGVSAKRSSARVKEEKSDGGARLEREEDEANKRLRKRARETENCTAMSQESPREREKKESQSSQAERDTKFYENLKKGARQMLVELSSTE